MHRSHSSFPNGCSRLRRTPDRSCAVTCVYRTRWRSRSSGGNRRFRTTGRALHGWPVTMRRSSNGRGEPQLGTVVTSAEDRDWFPDRRRPTVAPQAVRPRQDLNLRTRLRRPVLKDRRTGTIWRVGRGPTRATPASRQCRCRPVGTAHRGRGQRPLFDRGTRDATVRLRRDAYPLALSRGAVGVRWIRCRKPGADRAETHLAESNDRGGHGHRGRGGRDLAALAGGRP